MTTLETPRVRGNGARKQVSDRQRLYLKRPCCQNAYG